MSLLILGALMLVAMASAEDEDIEVDSDSPPSSVIIPIRVVTQWLLK